MHISHVVERCVPWKAEKQIIKPLAGTIQIGERQQAGWASVSLSFLSLRRMKDNKSLWKKIFINPVCTCREDTLWIAERQNKKKRQKAARLLCWPDDCCFDHQSLFFIIECKNTWKYTQQTRQQIRMAFVSIVPLVPERRETESERERHFVRFAT